MGRTPTALRDREFDHEHHCRIQDHRPRWSHQGSRRDSSRHHRIKLFTEGQEGRMDRGTKWNEVTIFNDATQGFVQRNLSVGDLVYAAGTLGQNSYERDGERVFTVTLACEQIERLAKANGRQDAAENQDGGRAGADEIPF